MNLKKKKMPPKKKKGDDGKGKKKGKKNAKKVVVGPPPPEPLNEEAKEYFLVQIHDLENRIARYVRKFSFIPPDK